MLLYCLKLLVRGDVFMAVMEIRDSDLRKIIKVYGDPTQVMIDKDARGVFVISAIPESSRKKKKVKR